MATARSRFVYPPLDYSVTLANVSDFHIKHNPSETAYTFSEDGNPTPVNVSFLELGRAVHRAAHYIRPERHDPERQTIAFVALSDSLLYQAVTLGIMKAGYVPYPMSPRNTAAAIIKLMKDSSCHTLLTTQHTLRPLLDDISSQLASSDPEYGFDVIEVPLLSAIFPKLGGETHDDSFQEYPDGPSPTLSDVTIFSHSSGSTGLPKTVALTVKSMVDWASFPCATDFKDFKVDVKLAGHALPPFHSLALFIHLLLPTFAMVPIGLYPPTANTPHAIPVIPTPHNILDHVTRSGCTNLVTIPTLIQIWAQDPKAVAVLASLNSVIYGGACLPSKIGNALTDSGVHITPIYGTTEFGPPIYIFRKEEDKNDWEYLRFSDRGNVRWAAQGDGSYEGQFLTTDTHDVCVQNLPDAKGYASSDLFVPHPTKSYLWKIVGRIDDVLIHTSGEKTVPGPMEDILMSSPYILAAVVFGRERDQPGVLIELKPAYQINVHDESLVIEVRNLLWPIVEEANKVAPAFSRLFKEMILIASKDKPFIRAGKGTVIRKATLAYYATEIDEIYAEVGATANVEGVVPPTSWDIKDISDWLSGQVSEIIFGTPVYHTRDLFEQGMDSLSATILRRRIAGAMRTANVPKAAEAISSTTIYEHPSIEKLAEFIAGVAKDPAGYVKTNDSQIADMELMVKKYSNGLDVPLSRITGSTGDRMTILLTGSTGSLGAHILAALLQDSAVNKVYVLNRPSLDSKTVQQRQVERFKDKSLELSLLSNDNLVYLEGETSHHNLGLEEDVYNELLANVNVIIHNAWRVDFNLSLWSFESNVQGTRNLIDLARASDQASAIKFIFTSSVSTAFSWDKSQGPYPEEVIQDPKFAVGSGYGESKYVTERLLEASSIRATSLRIGQISGGYTNGSWSPNDWVPILVKSSIHLRALPAASGVATWIPVDFVSQAILDLVHSADSPSAINVVHPRPITWSSVISAINEALVSEGVLASPLPLVDIQTWVSYLQGMSSNPSDETLGNIPAIKILDFFSFAAAVDLAIRDSADAGEVEMGGLPAFSTAKAQVVSDTMRSLPQIGREDAQKWVKYWKDVGFFNTK